MVRVLAVLMGVKCDPLTFFRPNREHSCRTNKIPAPNATAKIYRDRNSIVTESVTTVESGGYSHHVSNVSDSQGSSVIIAIATCTVHVLL